MATLVKSNTLQPVKSNTLQPEEIEVIALTKSKNNLFAPENIMEDDSMDKTN